MQITLKYFMLTAIAGIFTFNANAQLRVMAAPVDVKTAAKKTFPVQKQEFPAVKDTTNIFDDMLNDDSDDLMENHPAGDIYNNIWDADKINPYKVPLSSLPDSISINCEDFIMPIHGRITSKFGPRRYRYHYGIDIALNVGDSVRSAFNGKVRIIDYDAGGYGNYIVVRHDNGLETVYAHLSRVKVKLNQDVKAGAVVGLGGNTGRSTGPHLHFETRYIGNALNPANIINFSAGRAIASTYILTKKKNFYYQRETQARQIAKYYKIRKGDNLSRIAARNGTTVSKLKKINGISGANLQPGKRLRIR